MILTYIEKLQQASPAKRKGIAFSVSALFTFLRTETSVIATNTVMQPIEQSASPLEAIRHAFGSIFDGSTAVYERE